MGEIVRTVRETLATLDAAIGAFRRRVSQISADFQIRRRDLSIHFDDLRKIQLRYLRAGLLPSIPLINQWGVDLKEMKPDSVARIYAATFLDEGKDRDGALMSGLAEVAAIGNHIYTLRAIFPEVEKVARERAYAPGSARDITSLPSMRHGATRLFLESPPKAFPVLWEHTDRFAMTLFEAFDYAYAHENESPHARAPLDRAFRKVPCRHRVSHGHDDDYNDVCVINALTILYITVRLGTVLDAIGQRVPHQLADRRATLQAGREDRRMINNMTALLLGIGKFNRPEL